jgi:hypothetical protein
LKRAYNQRQLAQIHAEEFKPMKLVKLFCTLLLASFVWAVPADAQKKPKPATPVCDAARARGLVEQQLAETKTIDDEAARIGLVVRIAELIWPAQEARARQAYAEAYDLAAQNYRSKGDAMKTLPDGGVTIPEDQRLRVIRSIARRDREWADKLLEEALKEPAPEANKSLGDWLQGVRTSDKLLRAATSLLPEQKELAVSIARRSLAYSIDWNGLPQFFYQLAAVDQPLADAFYLEALARYAAGPVDEFLYLSAYPFGTARSFGPNATSAYYRVPPNFAPDSRTQQAFLAALFQAAQQVAQAPNEPRVSQRRGTMAMASTQLFFALVRLEPFIARFQPGLAAQANDAKTMLASVLTQEMRQNIDSVQQLMNEVVERDTDKPACQQLAEWAEKEQNSSQRDNKYANVVLSCAATEPFEWVETQAQKVGYEPARTTLLNWFYLRSGQRAAQEGRYDDAKRLAQKVSNLSHRAYLYFEVARAAYDKNQDRSAADEALREALAQADKADNGPEKARTMLGASNLYAKFDNFRAAQTMNDAVRAVNRSGATDFNSGYIRTVIKGDKWTVYTGFNVAGFNLETSFQSLGKADFEGALASARNLENKALRVTAVVALAVPCLEAKPPA